MKIKRFNESTEKVIDKVFVVLSFDVGGFLEYDECKSFSDQMLAADYFIKLINEKYETDFEAFYEGDTRLFTSVEENPDYDKCIDYANQNECDVEITDLPLLTKPEDLNI